MFGLTEVEVDLEFDFSPSVVGTPKEIISFIIDLACGGLHHKTLVG